MPPSPSTGRVVERLTIVCPEFAEAFARESRPMPSLERLAAYARAIEKPYSHGRLDAWQGELLDALALDSAKYPSAPVTWFGATGEPVGGTWMHADPVFLALSAQGLELQYAPAWTSEQLDRVTSLVREHLAADGLTWRAAGNRSFIYASGAINARTDSVRAAASMPLSDALPTGPDAQRVRQVMNDMQMLMHERLGATAPNGVWLWGVGALPAATAHTLPSIWADDDFARGVYRLHGASDRCLSVPESLDEVLSRSGDAHRVALVHTAQLATIEEAWFAPALRALNAGRVREVEVCLDGWRIRARKSLLRRLLTRPRPLHEVLQ